MKETLTVQRVGAVSTIWTLHHEVPLRSEPVVESSPRQGGVNVLRHPSGIEAVCRGAL